MGHTEKKVWLKILNMYKQMRFLWDRADSDYLNWPKRQEGLEILVEEYKRFDPDMTVTSLKKKMDNMRTAYNREFKKVMAAKAKGELYSPTLWYYESLNFLQDPDTSCQHDVDSINSFGEASRSSTPQSFNKDIHSQQLSIQPLSKEKKSQESKSQNKWQTLAENQKTKQKATPEKKQRMNFVKVEQELEEGEEYGEEEYEENYSQSVQSFISEEEWETIGKAIGIQLRELDKRQSAIAQKLISDAIFYAKMGKLTEGAFVSLTNKTD